MANQLQSDQEHLQIVIEFVEALDEYRRLSNLPTEALKASTEFSNNLERARIRCRNARRVLKRWPRDAASLN